MGIDTLKDRVRHQRDDLPALYGNIDFDIVPHRLALDPDDESDLPKGLGVTREELLADKDLVELMSTATMLGDVVCDAYVGLIGTYGMNGLIKMLRTACREGIDAVDDPPAELVAFMDQMETVPDWIDIDLVERGARRERVQAALLSPFVIRGAFLATFINEYAALPMALTGSLSDKRSAKRVNETAAFFATTVLPGGMTRNGPGFEAAAMVRLMHSMVRYGALHRSDKWDQKIYGIPIPQVDQMPAGLIGAFLTAHMASKAGRTEFTDSERALIETSRYRCYLLGLPEELLPTSLEGIIRVMLGRAATLRKGFDDDTCGELVRATMGAYLRPDHSLVSEISESFERSLGTAFFVNTFLGGNQERAKEMGVDFGLVDQAKVAIAAPMIFGRAIAVQTLNKFVPPIKPVTDWYVTWILKQRIKSYGHAEYVSDSSKYTGAKAESKPAPKAAAPAKGKAPSAAKGKAPSAAKPKAPTKPAAAAKPKSAPKPKPRAAAK